MSKDKKSIRYKRRAKRYPKKKCDLVEERCRDCKGKKATTKVVEEAEDIKVNSLSYVVVLHMLTLYMRFIKFDDFF